MRVDWKMSEDFDSFGVALKRYKRFLENKGCRQTTIENYSGCVRRYITFCQTPAPTNKEVEAQKVESKMTSENVEKAKAGAKKGMADIGNKMAHAKADIKATVEKATADVEKKH